MDPHTWEETEAQRGEVVASCGDNRALEFPGGCGLTHLNFILSSTTWLTTVADVILETKGQALRVGTTPRLPTSALQAEQEMGAPLGEAALACSSDPCSAQQWPLGVTTVPGLGKAWQPPPPLPQLTRRLRAQKQLTFSNMADLWE